MSFAVPSGMYPVTACLKTLLNLDIMFFLPQRVRGGAGEGRPELCRPPFDGFVSFSDARGGGVKGSGEGREGGGRIFLL